MGGPHVGPTHVGPPTWAQAWAQAPPPPAPAPAPPAPDEFSDPNLTPLPTHPCRDEIRRKDPCCDIYIYNIYII